MNNTADEWHEMIEFITCYNKDTTKQQSHTKG